MIAAIFYRNSFDCNIITILGEKCSGLIPEICNSFFFLCNPDLCYSALHDVLGSDIISLISASRATCEVLGENRDPTIYICVVVDAT
jgi:hypothetical protein